MMTIAVAPLTTTFLVAIRLGTVFLLSPIEAIRVLPIHARLLLVLILSMLIVANLPLPELPPDELSLVMSGIAELCNGLILSLSLYAAFAVFQIAGQLMDTQMGLNSMGIFNPADHSNEPLSGRLLVMLAVLFFFAVSGHLKLVKGLVMSFMIIAPGQLSLFNGYAPIIQQCSLMFSLSIMIASPVVIGLLVIDVAGAVLTRNMPQISTYFLTLPIKIMLGLIIFGLLLTYINPAMDYVFSSCFQSWTAVMA
jgi:flagellar biosynthetic protein FliR